MKKKGGEKTKKFNGKKYDLASSGKYPDGIVPNRVANETKIIFKQFGYSIRTEKVSKNKRRVWFNIDKVPDKITRKKRR